MLGYMTYSVSCSKCSHTTYYCECHKWAPRGMIQHVILYHSIYYPPYYEHCPEREKIADNPSRLLFPYAYIKGHSIAYNILEAFRSKNCAISLLLTATEKPTEVFEKIISDNEKECDMCTHEGCGHVTLAEDNVIDEINDFLLSETYLCAVCKKTYDSLPNSEIIMNHFGYTRNASNPNNDYDFILLPSAGCFASLYFTSRV